MPLHPPVPVPRGRALIPLLIVALCTAFSLGVALLLGPFGAGPATAAVTVGPRGDARIYSRLEPSVVDVTATLRYEGETASGTGFVVDARAGLVLTNNHVIRNATAVTVRLTSTGRIYPARIVGADVAADIAVLQLQGATGLTAAPLGSPAGVPAGTPVLAIGNRGGKDGSPAAAPGVIDGRNRTIVAKDGLSGFTETLHGMLQTSARIEPGDSGGPLADPAGRVIGVDTAAGAGTSRAGFAIPIGTAMAAERQITARRPAAGITAGTGGFPGVVEGHLFMASSERGGISSGYPELRLRPGAGWASHLNPERAFSSGPGWARLLEDDGTWPRTGRREREYDVRCSR